jgi:PAS domain S-box-containing protein
MSKPPASASTVGPHLEWIAQVAQAVDEMVWVWRVNDGHLLYANTAFEVFRNVGAQAQANGRHALLERIHPDDRERMRRARQQVESSSYSEEYRVQLPADGDRPARMARVRERAFHSQGPDGEAWVTHIARDESWQFDTTAQLRAEIGRRTDAERNLSDVISRRKGAERALAESEAKYRKVVENVNEGILVTAAGRILYANPRALDLTGLEEEVAKSRPFIEFIHADDRDRVLGNHLRRVKGESVENNYQFRVVHKNGAVRWLEISAVAFDWQNTPATLIFLTDVTERRQIEQDMRAALARERELSELKSRFVAVASHEFRTPLAAILSSVELLDDYGSRLPDAERKEIVGLVKNAVSRMNRMVEQVLLTSRLEAGKFSFEPYPRNIPELLVQVASEMDQAHPQASRIAMQWEGVGQSRLVDPKLLGHILVNLLGNALKYSPPDSAVTCIATAEGEKLRLSVSDRGIGVPAADLPRLFESFHRGTNVGNIQGTGIGLHIVKECVELHGGSIAVESTAGQGATFHVQLHAPPAG